MGHTVLFDQTRTVTYDQKYGERSSPYVCVVGFVVKYEVIIF
jgi:hypothetical protein